MGDLNRPNRMGVFFGVTQAARSAIESVSKGGECLAGISTWHPDLA